MNYKNYIMLALAGAAFAFTGCEDEFINGATKKNFGDEIVFGARAGYEMNKKGGTRTIYAGKDNSYTENGKEYEKVNWVLGDQVRVYCPDAASLKVADYTVYSEGLTDSVSDVTNKAHATGLQRIGDASLQWGGQKQHTFYAVYPSPLQYSSTVFSGDDEATLVGVIPGTQYHSGIYHVAGGVDNSDYKYSLDENGNHTTVETGIPATGTLHVVKPDMKYAYMVAKTEVADPDKMGNVFLNFMPIATAVEITLRNLAWKESLGNGEDIDLTNVVVSSADGNPIYGGFDAKLTSIAVNSDGYGNEYPDVTVSDNVASGSSINIPMIYSDGEKGEPLELKFGDAVRFTVFVLPTQDLEDLTITFSGIQGSHTGTLKGIIVEKHKKTYLNQVPITGEVLPFDYSSWIRWLGEEALVRGLSIPGAGGAATYSLTSADITESGLDVTAENIMQQTVNMQQQWDAGIRCFEFSVDLNGTSTTNSLGDSKIICSGVQMSMTLKEAIQEIWTLLKANPEEFAMAIITYETSGGWSGTRTPATFMAQLNKFWAEVEQYDGTSDNPNITIQTKLYDPSTATVGSSRGKLFCIARPTSIHQDYGISDELNVLDVLKPAGTDLSSFSYDTEEQCNVKFFDQTKTLAALNLPAPHEHIVLIQGWGATKDKWQQRGYTRHSQRGWSKYNTSGDYIQTGVHPRPFDVSTISNGSGNVPTASNYTIDTTFLNKRIDFSYDILDYSGNTITDGAWVQEWARVSNDGSTVYKLDQSGNSYKAILWGKSYDEKLLRVQECLQYAQKKLKGDIVYINSLCGYYVTQGYASSLYPCTFTDIGYNKNTGTPWTLTAASPTAGMGGDIANFAADINKAFYEYLLGIDTDYTAGSMGIVLMDRVGVDYGANIPGVIIANNFQFDLESEVAKAMNVYDETSETPVLAAPSVHEEKSAPVMVWE